MPSTWKKILALFGVRTLGIATVFILGKVFAFILKFLLALLASSIFKHLLISIKNAGDPVLADWLVPPIVMQVAPVVVFVLTLLLLVSSRKK